MNKKAVRDQHWQKMLDEARERRAHLAKLLEDYKGIKEARHEHIRGEMAAFDSVIHYILENTTPAKAAK